SDRDERGRRRAVRNGWRMVLPCRDDSADLRARRPRSGPQTQREHPARSARERRGKNPAGDRATAALMPYLDAARSIASADARLFRERVDHFAQPVLRTAHDRYSIPDE